MPLAWKAAFLFRNLPSTPSDKNRVRCSRMYTTYNITTVDGFVLAAPKSGADILPNNVGLQWASVWNVYTGGVLCKEANNFCHCVFFGSRYYWADKTCKFNRIYVYVYIWRNHQKKVQTPLFSQQCEHGKQSVIDGDTFAGGPTRWLVPNGTTWLQTLTNARNFKKPSQRLSRRKLALNFPTSVTTTHNVEIMLLPHSGRWCGYYVRNIAECRKEFAEIRQ